MGHGMPEPKWMAAYNQQLKFIYEMNTKTHTYIYTQIYSIYMRKQKDKQDILLLFWFSTFFFCFFFIKYCSFLLHFSFTFSPFGKLWIVFGFFSNKYMHISKYFVWKKGNNDNKKTYYSHVVMNEYRFRKEVLVR